MVEATTKGKHRRLMRSDHQPMNGLPTPIPTQIIEHAVEAAVVLMPYKATRKGMPHSAANAVIGAQEVNE